MLSFKIVNGFTTFWLLILNSIYVTEGFNKEFTIEESNSVTTYNFVGRFIGYIDNDCDGTFVFKDNTLTSSLALIITNSYPLSNINYQMIL